MGKVCLLSTYPRIFTSIVDSFSLMIMQEQLKYIKQIQRLRCSQNWKFYKTKWFWTTTNKLFLVTYKLMPNLCMQITLSTTKITVQKRQKQSEWWTNILFTSNNLIVFKMVDIVHYVLLYSYGFYDINLLYINRKVKLWCCCSTQVIIRTAH